MLAFKLRFRGKNNEKREESFKYIRISVLHRDRKGVALVFMCKHSKEMHSDGLGVRHTVGNAWKREEHESSAV